MDIIKKLNILMAMNGINQSKLAELSGQSCSNLSNKMVRNTFKISELEKLANALDCKLEINFILSNGEKV